MSLKQIRFAIPALCCVFVLTACFTVSEIQAQVPTTTPSRTKTLACVTDNNSNTQTLSTVGATTITKVMPEASVIPFSQAAAASALLDMKGYDAEFSRTFTFKNTTSSTVTINSVDFEKADNLFDFRAIEPGESMPLDVAPGKTFTIRVAFHSIDRNRLATNRLAITTEQNTQPIMFPIQAIQQPLSAMPWNKKIASVQTK